MDAYIALISMRTVREYSDRQISDDSLNRVLQAGRASGSSQNRQPWQFYVVRDPNRRYALAETVHAPANLEGCQVAIAIGMTSRGGFDGGRCAQNIMLAAWAEGIGSAPNGVRDVEQAMGLLGMVPEQSVVTIISLGYPLQPHTPDQGDASGILQRIKRRPLEEIVVRVE